jgi:hypothetical protein
MIFFASLKSLKKGVGSRSAPICHGSPTMVNMHKKNKDEENEESYFGRIGRRR